MTRKYCLIIVPRGAAGSPFSTKLLFGFHNTLFAHANQHFVFILALERDRAMSSRNVDRDLHKLLRISCQAKSDTSSDLAYRLDKVSQLCSPKDPRIWLNLTLVSLKYPCFLYEDLGTARWSRLMLISVYPCHRKSWSGLCVASGCSFLSLCLLRLHCLWLLDCGEKIFLYYLTLVDFTKPLWL